MPRQPLTCSTMRSHAPAARGRGAATCRSPAAPRSPRPGPAASCPRRTGRPGARARPGWPPAPAGGRSCPSWGRRCAGRPDEQPRVRSSLSGGKGSREPGATSTLVHGPRRAHPTHGESQPGVRPRPAPTLACTRLPADDAASGDDRGARKGSHVRRRPPGAPGGRHLGCDGAAPPARRRRAVPAMSRNVFLHVGLPKSGTSYLQKTLTANKDDLERGGPAVPGTRVGRPGARRAGRPADAPRPVEAQAGLRRLEQAGRRDRGLAGRRPHLDGVAEPREHGPDPRHGRRPAARRGCR